MAATLPSGIGNAQQAQQATWFLRNQPWYQQWVQQNRIPLQTNAYGDVRLSEAQQQDLLNLARQHGIGISDRYQINENGQIAETPSHLWRNIGIGAAIGGAALTGFGAAGIGPLAGVFGGGAGAAGAGTAAAEGAGVGTGTAAGVGAGTAAAGTGAGVAGTAAAAGAGWFSPTAIIPAGIQGVATIFGANQQANANKEAAQLQYQSTEEALKDARDQRAYQQAQYANYLGRLQPYLGLGTTASSTLQNLLARSPYTRLANSGPLPQYSTAPPMQPNAPQGPGSQAQSTSPVMMKAPDGSTKSVDPAQVNHYMTLGAVPV